MYFHRLNFNNNSRFIKTQNKTQHSVIKKEKKIFETVFLSVNNMETMNSKRRKITICFLNYKVSAFRIFA